MKKVKITTLFWGVPVCKYRI